MLQIITSNSDKLFSGVNIDDLEWPWTTKIWGFTVYFAICGCSADFKSELWSSGWRQNKTTCEYKLL